MSNTEPTCKKQDKDNYHAVIAFFLHIQNKCLRTVINENNTILNLKYSTDVKEDTFIFD